MAIKRSIENVWQSHLQFRSELLNFFFPIKLISYKYASYSFQEVPCIYWSFFTGIFLFTGKSLSEALIFASTKVPSSNLGRTSCVQKLFLTFRTTSVHMFSPCSAIRRASDKDLPVLIRYFYV